MGKSSRFHPGLNNPNTICGFRNNRVLCGWSGELVAAIGLRSFHRNNPFQGLLEYELSGAVWYTGNPHRIAAELPDIREIERVRDSSSSKYRTLTPVY